MLRWVVGFVALAIAGAAVAADLPSYGPPAPWVQIAPIPAPPPDAGAPDDQLLLHDDQFRADADGDHDYHRAVYKIRGPAALPVAGLRQISWDPSHDTLVIHHVLIRRGDQVIDTLADGKGFQVIRRETNLERAMLDGDLTAIKQIEGLQVGDIVDYAFTITSRDPVKRGFSEWNADMFHQGVAGRVRMRAVWTKDKPIKWQAAEGLGPPTITHDGGETQLLIDLTNVAAPRAPAGAPTRFQHVGRLRISQYGSWADVSTLMAPLYAKAETPSADSPIRAEIAKIKAAASDPKVRAGLALALVEDQIRYLALSMGDGGYVPASADDTWSHRFGDCKAKTVLLLALLHGLGIEAQPALINTREGDGEDQRLPGLLFDHVMVRATIGGRVYWLDGTRQGDHLGIDALRTPPFHWALPVQAKGAVLTPLAQTPFDTPQMQMRLEIDASGGLSAPAPTHIRQSLRGDFALTAATALARASQADAQRAWRQAMTKVYPWLTIDKIALAFDDKTGVFTIEVDGSAQLEWRRNRDLGGRELRLVDANMPELPKRPPGPGQDAPFSVTFPYFIQSEERVKLPGAGAGFTMVGDPVNETVDGFAVARRGGIEDGTAIAEASIRALQPEISAASIDASNAKARDLAEDPMTLRAPKS